MARRDLSRLRHKKKIELKPVVQWKTITWLAFNLSQGVPEIRRDQAASGLRPSLASG